MGTVHGVYLKYVALSAISYAGYAFFDKASIDDKTQGDGLQRLSSLYLGYSAILNGIVAVLFKMEWGMSMIGKQKETGKIPLWSYIVFAPFHMYVA